MPGLRSHASCSPASTGPPVAGARPSTTSTRRSPAPPGSDSPSANRHRRAARARDRPRDPHPRKRRHRHHASRARCHPTTEPRHRESTAVLTLVGGCRQLPANPSDRRPTSLTYDELTSRSATIASPRALTRTPRDSSSSRTASRIWRHSSFGSPRQSTPAVRWPPTSAGCHSAASHRPGQLRACGLAVGRVAAVRAVARAGTTEGGSCPPAKRSSARPAGSIWPPRLRRRLATASTFAPHLLKPEQRDGGPAANVLVVGSAGSARTRGAPRRGELALTVRCHLDQPVPGPGVGGRRRTRRRDRELRGPGATAMDSDRRQQLAPAWR